jgi:outer membrane protein assembly factor BamB
MESGSSWREAQSPDGKTYYFNSTTKVVMWEKPAELGGTVHATKVRALSLRSSSPPRISTVSVFAIVCRASGS